MEDLANLLDGLNKLKGFREEIIKDFHSDYVVDINPINANAYLSMWRHESRINCKVCKVTIKMNGKEFSGNFNIDTEKINDVQFLYEQMKQQVASILLEHLVLLIKPLIDNSEVTND